MERLKPGEHCASRIVVDDEPDHEPRIGDRLVNAGDAMIWRNPGEGGRRYLEVRCGMCQETHHCPIEPYEEKPGWLLMSREPLTMQPSVKIGPTYDGYVCHYTITNGVFNAHADSNPRKESSFDPDPDQE